MLSKPLVIHHLQIPDSALLSSQASILLLLLLAHFVGDFTLQSSAMARGKVPGGDAHIPWGWWLGAHASTHAFLVLLITGSFWIGLFELLSHAVLDWAKIRGLIDFNADQLLHLGLKVVWLVLLILH